MKLSRICWGLENLLLCLTDDDGKWCWWWGLKWWWWLWWPLGGLLERLRLWVVVDCLKCRSKPKRRTILEIFIVLIETCLKSLLMGWKLLKSCYNLVLTSSLTIYLFPNVQTWVVWIKTIIWQFYSKQVFRHFSQRYHIISKLLFETGNYLTLFTPSRICV